MKTLIIGQAPSRLSDPAEPLSGRSGRRLALLCGMPFPAFLAAFDRRNVFPAYPGAAGAKGDLFPASAAAEAVLELIPLMRDRAVVLLGRKVVRALDEAVAGSARLARVPPLVWSVGADVRIAWCPHPSGVSRWWNDAVNARRAQRFWRTLAEESRP